MKFTAALALLAVSTNAFTIGPTAFGRPKVSLNAAVAEKTFPNLPATVKVRI